MPLAKPMPFQLMTPVALAIPIIVLALPSAALLAFWSVAIVKITRTTARLPDASAGIDLADRSPPEGRVCVVVPAHNEESSIEALVASLRAQTHPRARFVLALDRCTDATERLARAAIDGDERFEIVAITACPKGWAGKVHAAWSGVTESQGAADADYLLFTDADCQLHPRALDATVALLEDRSLDMLSLFSTLAQRTWFERLVQPATSFELARQYPLLRANDPDAQTRRPFANGQFMLFRAQTYHAMGGHDAVRDALLEDIAFARRLTKLGHATGLLLASGIVRCAMYDTWAQYRRGWKRIYTESANRKPKRLRQSAFRLLVTGVALPACAIACALGAMFLATPGDWALIGPCLGVSFGAFLAWQIGLILVHVHGGSSVWAVPAYPLGALLTARILTEAARDLDEGVRTEWGGRSYVRDSR